MSWVGLQFVIVVFPDHTHLNLFLFVCVDAFHSNQKLSAHAGTFFLFSSVQPVKIVLMRQVIFVYTYFAIHNLSYLCCRLLL